jgi:uncharacterized protein (DUF362 family)/Pyruvate/2-oxoacid:ferredoxin oxidoreductase delta subunit
MHGGTLADGRVNFNREMAAGKSRNPLTSPLLFHTITAMHTVSIQKVATYDRTAVAAGLVRLLEPLGGMAVFVQPGERVLLKPNMLYGKAPECAVTTHPEVLRGVIGLVKAAGGIPLVGDSPGFGDIRKVADKTGMLAVIEETGAELVEFSEAVEVAGSGLFKRLELARPYLEADRVINLPKLKTHEMMTLTCGVKNLFGAVVGHAKAAWHLKAGADREMFARMLLDIYLLRPPDLTIVDAITAMEGDGPGSGDPVSVGLLLAGANAVAVDVIAAQVAGIPNKLLFVERAALKLGIEGANRKSVAVVGTGLDEARVAPFRLPHISDVQFGLPAFLKNRLRHYLTTRPCSVPEKCRLCRICVNACPPRAISVMEGKLHFDYHACIRCFCCRELCPDGALEVKEGAILKLAKRFR